MSHKGSAKNGVNTPPPAAKSPAGMEVDAISRDLLAEDTPFLASILKLAKPRPYWPDDFALNHAHYLKGHPKKS